MIKHLIPTALAACLVAAPALAAPTKPAPAKPAPKATPAPARPTPPPAPPEPQLLEPEDMPLGMAHFTLSGQMTSTNGLLGTFRTGLQMGGAELGASISMPPANPLSFFTVDAHLMFVGQTASFLPINLMPMMGFGMGTMFRDIPSGTSTKLDLGMWMHMPLGVRYALNLGGLQVGTEVSYYLPALFLMKPQTDPSRWHFEVHARTGPLLVGGFYELGAVYNGPGLRAGLAF